MDGLQKSQNLPMSAKMGARSKPTIRLAICSIAKQTISFPRPMAAGQSEDIHMRQQKWFVLTKSHSLTLEVRVGLYHDVRSGIIAFLVPVAVSVWTCRLD